MEMSKMRGESESGTVEHPETEPVTGEPEEATGSATGAAASGTEPAAPAAEITPKFKKKWYVIHTYSGHENKVKANLEKAIQYAGMQDRFGEILVATEDFAVVKDRKKTITRRKTFPSYVLVEVALNEEAKGMVTSIPGVTHFVGGENDPAPLTEAEIDRIRGKKPVERGPVTTEVPFKIGESVKVVDGPFSDFTGQVEEINLERGKVKVMVSIFGRATPVELDFLQVQAV